MLFEIINSLLYKTAKLDTNSKEFEDTFSPYMIVRWLTMHTPELVYPLNETINKIVLQNKLSHASIYNLLYILLPKLNKKYFSYIKRQRVSEESEEDITNHAKASGLSVREYKNYLNIFYDPTSRH